MNPQIQADRTFHYGFYCVAFLDILGQRRKLRALPRLPKDDEETRKLLKETAGYVLRLRNELNTCFELFKKPTQLLDGLPQEARDRIANARQSVKYRGFSDSIIMEISIAGDQEQLAPMTGVYGCMGACCILHGVALMSKRPIRGGIDVGPGLDISENEVYGPVLEHAHQLESELADYPRILVGEGLLTYLNTVERHIPTTPLGRVAKSLAARSKQLITYDTDGLPMLDFLGETMARSPNLEDRSKLFGLITEYIEEQKQVANSQKDQKHLSRYDRLGAYVEKRSTLWKAG
jgi:hypothetical protein